MKSAHAVEDLQGKDVETRLIHWLLKRCPQPRPSGQYEIAPDVTKNRPRLRAERKKRDALLEAQFRANLGETD